MRFFLWLGLWLKPNTWWKGEGEGQHPPPPPPLMSSCPQGGWQLDMKGEGEGRGADVCAQDYA